MVDIRLSITVLNKFLYNEIMILIDFFASNIVSTLIPVNTFLPEEIFMMISPRDLNTTAPSFLEEAIRSLYPRDNPVRFSFVQIDDSSLEDIKAKLEYVIDIRRDAMIYLNLSKSTEIMTIAGYSAGLEHDHVFPIYIDRRAMTIRDVQHGNAKMADIKHIDIDTYTIALGAKNVGNSRSLPLEEEYDIICEMSEYIFDHLKTWHALCNYLAARYASTQPGEWFSIPKMLDYNNKSYDVEKMVNRFRSYHFLNEHDRKYSYPSARYKEYMTTYGEWLELYTYIKAKGVFSDVRLGYKIDWTSNDSNDTLDNEIDVFAVFKSEPCFISCKMTEPSTQDLNEVGYLARHLRGIEAHPVIVTTSRIREDSDLGYRVYNKFIRLSIGLIEVKDFKTRNAKNLFLSAIK